MQKRLRSLGYPDKLLLYGILFIGTVIAMKYVVEVRLPDGGRPPYLFLIWNTFLAWIPAGLAIIMDLISLMKTRLLKGALLLSTGLVWLFFYPNAAYLITDLLHPFARYPISSAGSFWEDTLFWDHLFTVLFVALLGLALSSVSLASVHELVRRSFGRLTGWLFAAAVLLAGSFGVYLGRFNRFNSWDILHHPRQVLKDIALYFTNIENIKHAIVFCKWIFLITGFCYVLLYLFGAMRKGGQADTGSVSPGNDYQDSRGDKESVR
ncbi:DUF1361 domain-containing protein [Paenibacillus sp. M1]|uniref:DUF1361 domain-containing protein n=1 Tax=Paenibacillus haidiansis TaxID=1574488 RepID=A0ABU7VYB0_9BACL